MGRFIVNLLATILVVLVNALANILPINGQTTGEISDKLNVLFTPAGYVFGIWGLIYFLLFIWTIRQFPSSRRNLPVYKKATPFYLLSSALNIAWILLWHYEFFLLTVCVMIGLLLTLIKLYHVIKNENTSFWDLFPFSVYLGWISVATIANISYYLKHIGWNGFGFSDVAWAIIMLVIATLLALYFTFKNKDRIYPLVFIWAIIGIGLKNAASLPSVSTTSYVLSAIILIGIFFSLNRKH
ncbi:tryptophan-rich sensory protein [Mesobacillus boroniphilus]|uniref:Tryptophan-rich sensory protein n=1 Tax=Mesobacillus boroniphilus TaxID=308892 RepID=A0A944CNT9_9BACI|nr:TspO/MBR family protein [Mesobacillus boroniphilus]MBS8266519.1 tryptophan-rich sensory protein [Mesobacillus boroniphilus]